MRTIVICFVAAACGMAQPQAAPQQGGQQQGGRAGQGGRGGQGGGGQQAQQVPSKSRRVAGSSLGFIRIGGADQNMWFGWNVGVPASVYKGLTYSDALEKLDLATVANTIGSPNVKVSYEVPKLLTPNLQPGELRAIVYRLREMNQQMRVYRAENIPSDPAAQLKLFEFAKALNVETIEGNPGSASLADLDKLATEIGVNLAITSKDPKAAMTALNGRGKRLGISADTGVWMQENIKPVDGLAIVKDKLMVVNVRDRSALGPKGHDVVMGAGAGGLGEFFLAAYRAEIKPLTIVIEASNEAELLKSLDGFEQKTMLQAMTARVNKMLDSPAGKIRDGSRLDADMRKQIEAAVPREAIVKPKKPRKLLVTDIQMYSGHGTIPHGNYMLELMAKTGAFEATFSNDPNMLKYPKIKEFDAVFLNNVCGMTFPDPEVRDGILRFVREGGGIGGNHAVTFSNNHWPDYIEMMGGFAGAHHTEKQVMKVDDPNSPLMKSFGSVPFEHTDEFYIMPEGTPFSRDKQHVLMSIDVEKSDRATSGKFCPECTRKDQDYAFVWIKTFGKGRVYISPLGHTPIMYTDKRWTTHMLAAVQFILGDLDADTTPSSKLAKK
jgi:type 1 glutamine amidotransferase